MPFNNMLKTRINLLKLRALTETDNYINVSHQLEVETQIFLDSLEGEVLFNNKLADINTQNNIYLLYAALTFLVKFHNEIRNNVVLICKIVNSELLTPDQKFELAGIMLTTMTLLLKYGNRLKRDNQSEPVFKVIVRKINKFLKCFDMRKYSID